MGRKLFLSHLADATDLEIENIHSIHSPEEGVVAFTYASLNSQVDQVNIQAFANDLGEYPDGNSFVLCSNDASLDPVVGETLHKATENAHGKSIVKLLTEVAALLATAMTKGRNQEDTTTDHVMEDDGFDFAFEGDSDDECFGLAAQGTSSTEVGSKDIIDIASSSADSRDKMENILPDIQALKLSGFRVGIFGNIASAGILCVSIRVSKLGLSDEALQAWNVPRKHYFVLLIRYTGGYLDAARAIKDPDLAGSLGMRVGLCDHYKPSLRAVLALYQYTKADSATSADDPDAKSNDHHAFRALFIGNAINQFLQERALKIISARDFYQLSWLGAEKFINERQATPSSSSVDDMKPYDCNDDDRASNLPPIVVADHMRQSRSEKPSLPLILMQFALRHFVRCTEFCLVCHCRVDDGFEALKPYVCLKPLCLYQFMSLGFGPRLEWEIMGQPYVVDLLVSFCYAAASSGRLKEFPIVHGRVKSVELPQVWLDATITVPSPGLLPSFGRAAEESGEDDSYREADCYLYDKTFDSLDQEQQGGAIMTLLDVLPPVIEMRRSLKSQGQSQEPCLKACSRQIPEPALNLLRWIVASNRSCIMQVDDIGGGDGDLVCGKPEDRVGGMDSWVQFRFAQGAPDKEKRFNRSVKQHAQATGTKYPTLFAWHGSRMGNWHSIVRQGLRYDEILNGRSYGHGIYMSPHAFVSLGYSKEPVIEYRKWQGTVFKTTKVISLQEVVNDPAQFTSTNPHYVVPEVDWVQTRYLFVQTKDRPLRKDLESQIYEQDPDRPAHNEMGQPITIPITAISKTRRPGNTINTVGTPSGKRTKKLSETDLATAEQQEEYADSVVSDPDDLAAFHMLDQTYDYLEPSINARSLCVNSKKRPAEAAGDTDFVPGKLDVTNIKFMDPPQDANPMATKALMRLLKDALNTQETTPPATLGWYIDRNLISNMYQWIVELHSFPKDLPLAKDMKVAGVTSIVVEMRFTSQYPFSPPFIRVVKPRFLPFRRGGGGNITEGGAMCMEVLTNNGWSASLTVESLLLQVRLVISDTERPARLAGQLGSTYGVGEAKAAYIRACLGHGWTIPAGFETIQE
ncbi:hypothetical protein AYL99_06688 [Fonsecaea erecta]|uniref:UBC core domain-containing protein n=1 Tax=Fonsecaea erecta TaxID=1367422 RepID=A0A178ZHX8_9EURO|nr:hypothetical protein AYL99_06688 [Fonsecaea erecta]OAP59390.1 hypothetical protein AYL99_06688 [Fonsecaea erecta]